MEKEEAYNQISEEERNKWRSFSVEALERDIEFLKQKVSEEGIDSGEKQKLEDELRRQEEQLPLVKKWKEENK